MQAVHVFYASFVYYKWCWYTSAYTGMVVYCVILFYFIVDHKNFMIYCTGSDQVTCNELTIAFTDSSKAAAISVNTCFKTVTISTRISPPEFLARKLHCLLPDPDFTVEYQMILFRMCLKFSTITL